VSRSIDNDDRVVMTSAGLVVVFERSGDTWTHGLELPGQDGIEVVRAVESEPAPEHSTRAVSPVYQAAQRHERVQGSGLCLLLTGLVFEHHFSAAVCLRDHPAGAVLEFDIADRCRAPVDRLAANYLIRLDSCALLEAGRQAVAWTREPRGPGRLELCAEPPATLELARAGRQAMSVQVVAALERRAFTHRLRYHWRWESASGLTA
jgi:hypothetical protein